MARRTFADAPQAAPDRTCSGIDKDRPDTVFIGEWEIGRIYQTRGGPDSLRWFWSMNANGPMAAYEDKYGR
jgi:hypothetical protein